MKETEKQIDISSMKHILIFTLTALFFAIIKAIVDQIPVLVTIFFLFFFILFTFELIQLLKKEKKNRLRKLKLIIPIGYNIVEFPGMSLT